MVPEWKKKQQSSKSKTPTSMGEQYRIVTKDVYSGDSLPRFKSQPHPLAAVQPKAI